MKDRDDFEGWLMVMDDAIEQLMEDVPPELVVRLDFTKHSLSALESWLLTRYSSTEAILKESENFMLDRVARYVGETVRRNVPSAQWDIDLHDTSRVFYGLPVVRNGNKWVECPASLVSASLDRRTGRYMEGVLGPLIDN